MLRGAPYQPLTSISCGIYDCGERLRHGRSDYSSMLGIEVECPRVVFCILQDLTTCDWVRKMEERWCDRLLTYELRFVQV